MTWNRGISYQCDVLSLKPDSNTVVCSNMRIKAFHSNATTNFKSVLTDKNTNSYPEKPTKAQRLD